MQISRKTGGYFRQRAPWGRKIPLFFGVQKLICRKRFLSRPAPRRGKFFPSSRNPPGRPASLYYMDAERGRPGTLEFSPIPFCVPGSKIFPGVPAPAGGGNTQKDQQKFFKSSPGTSCFFLSKEYARGYFPSRARPSGAGTGQGDGPRRGRGDWEDLE